MYPWPHGLCRRIGIARRRGIGMKQGITSMAKPLTTNEHLIRWVEKMAELTEPAAIHWVDGSPAGVRLAVRPDGRRRAPSSASTRSCGRAASTRAPTRAMWRAWRTAPSSARSRRTTPGRPTTGKIPSRCGGSSRSCSSGCDARAHHVRAAVQHGAGRLAHVADRRGAHRLALRRGQHAHHGAHRRAGVRGDRQGRERA